MITRTLLACAAALSLGGCSTSTHDAGHSSKPTMMANAAPKVALAVVAPSKAATTQPTMNAVKGVVTFTEVADGVVVIAEITGLPANSKHGFHIHEKGDLSGADLMSTGPHWDPQGTHTHGAPATQPVHAGDMGNLSTDAAGTARLEMTLKGISIDDAKSGVVGRAVIVHAKPDDLSSQPAGNAGARIAGGLIETKK